MITKLSVPLLKQGDPRWGRQRLGTVNAATLAGYGCLITCLTMKNKAFEPTSPLLPNNVDDIFTNRGGYANNDNNGTVSPAPNCDMVIWGKIAQLLPSMNYHGAGAGDYGAIRNCLDQGGLPTLEVRWGGNNNFMHFVEAVGYTENDIVVHDPITGTRGGVIGSNLFGRGSLTQLIRRVQYFYDRVPNQPVAPEPSAPSPAAPPLVVTQGEEVTQLEHDAAINALLHGPNGEGGLDNLDHWKQVARDAQTQLSEMDALRERQANAIASLTQELSKYKPAYEATEADEPGTFITTSEIVVVDHADKMPPVVQGKGVIVEAVTSFAVNGTKYFRTQASRDAGVYYGFPEASLARYETAPRGNVLDTRPAVVLTGAQKFHLGAAEVTGLGRYVKNLNFFGRK